MSCSMKRSDPLYFVIADASPVFSMALWLVPHSVIILLICLASSIAVPSPEQVTKYSDTLDLFNSESGSTTFKRTSSIDLSWPAPYAPTTPIKINTSLTPAETVHNLTYIHLGAPRIQCNGSKYGRGLNIASCQEAWELLPTSTTRRTIGQRSGGGDFDVPLPFRVLSREYGRIQFSEIDLAHAAYLLR